MLSALKVKCFQPDFTIFFTRFFANGDKATTYKETSEFGQGMLNILRAIKFAEWKVRFSLISRITFSLGFWLIISLLTMKHQILTKKLNFQLILVDTSKSKYEFLVKSVLLLSIRLNYPLTWWESSTDSPVQIPWTPEDPFYGVIALGIQFIYMIYLNLGFIWLIFWLDFCLLSYDLGTVVEALTLHTKFLELSVKL